MAQPAPNEVPVQTVTTNQFSLNLRDVARGLIMAVLAAVLTAVYDLLVEGTALTDIKWGAVGGIALTTGISYLLKNFFDATRTVTIFKKK